MKPDRTDYLLLIHGKISTTQLDKNLRLQESLTSGHGNGYMGMRGELLRETYSGG